MTPPVWGASACRLSSLRNGRARHLEHGMSSSGTLGPLIPDQPRRLTREIFRPVPALKRALRRQDRSDPISRGIHLLGIAWPGANTPAFYFGLEQHAC